MHFMLHIVECIREFGPVHVFQTFATERLANELGSFRNNPVMPNVTFFRDFLHLQALMQVSHVVMYKRLRTYILIPILLKLLYMQVHNEVKFGWDPNDKGIQHLLRVIGGYVGDSNTDFCKHENRVLKVDVCLKWYRYLYDTSLSVNGNTTEYPLRLGDGLLGREISFFEVS